MFTLKERNSHEKMSKNEYRERLQNMGKECDEVITRTQKEIRDSCRFFQEANLREHLSEKDYQRVQTICSKNEGV